MPPVLSTVAILSTFLGAATPLPGQDTIRPVAVTFELNDAQTKGLALEGVAVRVTALDGGAELAAGKTGKDGRWTARLVPGTYQLAYRLEGFVPYESGATEVRRDGQIVTVSLSRLLESTEAGAREVRIILNWGSDPTQVKDADSHLVCSCGAPDGHVFYSQREHRSGTHAVSLDVDDTDWGGPETITLTGSLSGTYLYWVHDYSGPPATLGASDAVVRVVIGAEQAGEFRVPRGLTSRDWRPFKAIEAGKDGLPRLVPFTPDEIAEAADLVLPAQYRTSGATLPPPDPANTTETTARRLPLTLLAGVVAAMLLVRAALHRRRRGGRRR